MTITPATITRLLKEQHNTCANCWKSIPPYHVHHAVYTRDKRIKGLDDIENLQLLCPDCHSNHGYLSSWFGRCMAWTKKIDAGYDMDKWEKSLPMLIHDQFIYLGKKSETEKQS